MSVDEITLTVPRERPFYGVAHLVLGGLAVRLELTFENLEDLELALNSLLERGESGGEITVTHRVREDAIETVVGPFQGDALRAELERDAGDEFGLARILGAVVDRVELVERDGGHWVELTKNVRLAQAERS